MGFEKVAEMGSIPRGEGLVVETGGKKIAVFNCEGTFYATQNNCAHRGGPLADGLLEGTVVICPWHGWEFDVTSGECHTNPKTRIATFPVKVEGNDVLVDTGA
jgi:NAD(P)H-dependent nitrite reductase small subunit